MRNLKRLCTLSDTKRNQERKRIQELEEQVKQKDTLISILKKKHRESVSKLEKDQQKLKTDFLAFSEYFKLYITQLVEHVELAGDRYQSSILALKKQNEELRADVFPKNSINKKEIKLNQNEEKLTQELSLATKAFRKLKADFDKYTDDCRTREQKIQLLYDEKLLV